MLNNNNRLIMSTDNLLLITYRCADGFSALVGKKHKARIQMDDQNADKHHALSTAIMVFE